MLSEMYRPKIFANLCHEREEERKTEKRFVLVQGGNYTSVVINVNLIKL